MVRLTANARGLSTARLLPQKQQKSSLRIRSDTIEAFPRCNMGNFSQLRANRGFVYFDRTRYLSTLDSIGADVLLFLRPRRFGKSLTLSMLEHFHGVQYRAQYGELFNDLDVHKDVKKNRVTPGEYMILKFNFASVDRTPDLNKAAQELALNIIGNLEQFYRTYHPYLGGSLDQLISKNINQGSAISSLITLVRIVDYTLQEVKNGGDTEHPLANVKGIYLLADEYDAFSNEYMDPHNSQPWAESGASSLVKGFWATVKEMVYLPYGIRKCFITGISPLSLADITSGFNISVNISFKKEVAGLCGVSRADVQGALKKICQSKADVKSHLDRLTRYANGYHFCRYEKSEPVFNTDTSLEYLQAVLTGEDFDIASPPNSEVSPRFLEICASSPAAVTHIQNALNPSPDGTTQYHLIPYSKLVDRFTLADLQGSALGDGEEVAWRTLLLYFGAFTFDKENPSKFLTIPNRIAATRFGTTILSRFGLLGSMRDAVRFLALHGDIIAPLSGYRKLMAGRDIKPGGYAMTEWQHRESFHIAILENPGLDPQVEYEVTKPGGGLGLVDLVITSPGHCVVTEWKTVKIDFLDLGDSLSWDEKAEALSKLGINGVLELKFHEREKYKKGTIRDWIEKDVTAQLKSYVLSPEIRELARSRGFHAHLVLVVGSRKILVWEMDEQGDWIGQPVLA
ncbi:DUF1703-domain-containing protein [Choiromyces venosus 120613-1]|uniref:DUF1703-domain-containing protein n=1 Tax=Choiromyces venosus 120613-1 TaxID=1336337 RepID=A0A3N4IYZ5_9PEZI|nr:DUF1703-domain-containing protein [Choiromyces venosus 120613-1]